MKLQCMNEANTKLQNRIDQMLKDASWNYPEKVKSKKLPVVKSQKPKVRVTPLNSSQDQQRRRFKK